MRILKTFFTAISFAAISISAYAIPATGILSISNGTLNYDVNGDGGNSVSDGIFGANDWTLQGTFDLNYTDSGTPPAFDESVDWNLASSGSFSDLNFTAVVAGIGLVNASLPDINESFGPDSLGTGIAGDIFGGGVSSFDEVLTSAFDIFTGTPTLGDLFAVLSDVLGTTMTFALPDLVTDIADDILLSLSGDTVSFASTEMLSLGGQTPNTASANFSSSITLDAIASAVVDTGNGNGNGGGQSVVGVPEPGVIGLMGLGLMGIGMVMRRKHLVA